MKRVEFWGVAAGPRDQNCCWLSGEWVWQTTRPGECQVVCVVSEGDLWSCAVGSQSLSDAEARVDEN